MKVGTAIKNNKDKTDWIPAFPDDSQWGNIAEYPMKDEKGNDLIDLDRNKITTKVFVTTNPIWKEKLLSKHKPESDLDEKNQDTYQDSVQGALTFMEGQIERSIWK